VTHQPTTTPSLPNLPPAPPPSSATATEIESAIQGLTDADLTRLRKFAGSLLGKSPRGRSTYTTPYDLINTAIVKTLEGVRIWRSDLPFVTHLFSVMRSTIFHDANSKRVKSLADDQPKDDIADTTAESPEDMALTIENDREAGEILNGICDHFKTDADATNVLEGSRAGYSGREIMDYFGMTKKQFEAAWKRIRRHARSDKDGRK
jgi:DNA-directed RNA polymerase specialized sigma24 family protein